MTHEIQKRSSAPLAHESLVYRAGLLATHAGQKQTTLRYVCFLFVLLLAIPAYGEHEEPTPVKENTQTSLVSIPLSTLVVDQATATVSALHDPLSPMKTVLKLCQSDTLKDIHPEGDEVVEDIQKLCHTIDGLTRDMEIPTHTLQSGEYVVTVPLKEPQKNIQAVVWRAKTLDEAITFVDLLQNEKLKAVIVYPYAPWSSDPHKVCSECPIKDLVFHAAKIRDQPILGRKSDR